MVSQPELHPVWSSAELKGSSRSTRSVPARVRKSSVCLSALSVIRQTEDFETAPRTLHATTASGDPSLCLEEPARRRRMCDLTAVASSPTVVRQPAYARFAPDFSGSLAREGLPARGGTRRVPQTAASGD